MTQVRSEVGKPRKVLAGIKFDGQHWRLAMEAAALARHWQAELHLVHVLPPLKADSLTPWQEPQPTNLRLSTAVNEVRLNAALAHMQELAGSIGSDLALVTQVRVGEVVPSLLAEARACGADLLVAGRPDDMSECSLTNLPTTFGLASQAPCAFLMIPDKSHSSFCKEHLKVLLCDDLTPQSDRAIAWAENLAVAVDASEVLHLHVVPLSEHEFLKEVTSAIAHLDGYSLDHELRSLYQQSLDAAKLKLAERVPHSAAETGSAHAPTGSHHSWQVLSRQDDDLSLAVDEIAHELGAEVVVFGRQRLAPGSSPMPQSSQVLRKPALEHKHPLGIGRAALAHMVQCKKALLLAP